MVSCDIIFNNWCSKLYLIVIQMVFLKKKYHNGWKSSIFAEGASINQPLLFTEENILEVRMKIFLEFVDRGV